MSEKITADVRKKYATVHTKDGKGKYPIDSVHSAKSALRLINNAKPKLSSSQKSAVRKEAAEYGVKSSSDTKKPAKKEK